MLTFINKTKCHMGIVALATSKFIADAGIFTALVGIFIVYIINCYTAWLILKARNRFKNHRITSLYDLALKLHGENVAILIGFLQCVGCIFFCIIYQTFMS